MNYTDLEAYFACCDTIYDDWKQRPQNPELAEFDTQYLPEPFLDFGEGEDACLFVTTNPGAGMEMQLADGVSQLASGSLPTTYRPLSKIMSRFYETSGQLKGAPLANIRAMRSIAAALGFSRVLQLEIVPWHSTTLPNKRKMLEKLEIHPSYSAYANALRKLVQSSPAVLSWSGGDPSKRGGDGVEFKASTLGLDLKIANFLEITRTTKPSQALLWTRNNERLRGIFVNRAAANLPKRLDDNGFDRYAYIARVVGC